MNKIYCLINKENGYNVAASKTRRALEELMCDMFMEDFRAEMQEAANAHWINMENPSGECKQYARETWDMILRFYDRTYEIERVKIV